MVFKKSPSGHAEFAVIIAKRKESSPTLLDMNQYTSFQVYM